MPKLLRLIAALLFLVTVFAVRSSAIPPNYPTCFSDLPHYGYPDPSWQYSHQCKEGTTIWYVYIDFRGKWKLCSSTILP